MSRNRIARSLISVDHTRLLRQLLCLQVLECLLQLLPAVIWLVGHCCKPVIIIIIIIIRTQNESRHAPRPITNTLIGLYSVSQKMCTRKLGQIFQILTDLPIFFITKIPHVIVFEIRCRPTLWLAYGQLFCQMWSLELIALTYASVGCVTLT